MRAGGGAVGASVFHDMAYYIQFVGEARAYFGVIWRALSGPNINQSTFEFLTRELTLCSMYFASGTLRCRRLAG